MKKNYFLIYGLLIVMSMFLVTNTMQAQLYINEFMASNDGAIPGPQGDHPDWIEIYNAGTEPVMLGGYYMSDVLDNAAAMYQISSTYPDSVTVEAGGFIVFYANKGEASSVRNLNFKLSGSGESIGLWNPLQEVVDELTYTAQTSDVSYGRYPDGSNDWASMWNFTPGAANKNPATAKVILFINEFMASNDAAILGPQGDHPDWIEIYNAGTEPVMLGGYYMSDVLNDPTAMYQIPDTYPDSVTVSPGGFIVFYANKMQASSVLSLNFKLSGSGESIGLWNFDMMIVDSLTYGAQIADTSYGRFLDGSANWYMMADFTPGASNTNPNAGPAGKKLYINEFMASNDAAIPGPQGDHPDWIEIYNAGTEPVMLGGYYMADVLNDPTAMYQIPNTYPDSVTVNAGGFIVFYANKMQASSVLNLNFKLSGGGESIGLWNPEKVILDSLTYGPQIADTSYGRFPDGSDNWVIMPKYTPGLTNQNLVSISRNKANSIFSQNYPNPFRNETTIEFTLKKPDFVQISIYAVNGALVKTLVVSNFDTGKHRIQWDSKEFPAGLYLYSIKTSTGVKLFKMTKTQ